MEVYLVDYLLRAISNSVHFEYIDSKKAKEDFVEKDVNSGDDLKHMLFLLSKRVDKLNLDSKETKDSQGTNQPGKRDHKVTIK